jgi:hypothetical protein
MGDSPQDAPTRRVLTLAAALLAATPVLAAKPPGDWDEPGPVPEVPLAAAVESLAPIPLRREIARTEGRISDLEKSRAAELAGLAAAVAEARAEAGTAAAGATAGDTTPMGSAATDPLPAADRSTQRQRDIEQRYAQALAEARRRLHRLLEYQARIDPEAPDQRRLHDAATADTTRP